MDERGSKSERPDDVHGGRGRWGSTRKMELVLRILKGEDPDSLSRYRLHRVSAPLRP